MGEGLFIKSNKSQLASKCNPRKIFSSQQGNESECPCISAGGEIFQEKHLLHVKNYFPVNESSFSLDHR